MQGIHALRSTVICLSAQVKMISESVWSLKYGLNHWDSARAIANHVCSSSAEEYKLGGVELDRQLTGMNPHHWICLLPPPHYSAKTLFSHSWWPLCQSSAGKCPSARSRWLDEDHAAQLYWISHSVPLARVHGFPNPAAEHPPSDTPIQSHHTPPATCRLQHNIFEALIRTFALPRFMDTRHAIESTVSRAWWMTGGKNASAIARRSWSSPTSLSNSPSHALTARNPHQAGTSIVVNVNFGCKFRGIQPYRFPAQYNIASPQWNTNLGELRNFCSEWKFRLRWPQDFSKILSHPGMPNVDVSLPMPMSWCYCTFLLRHVTYQETYRLCIPYALQALYLDVKTTTAKAHSTAPLAYRPLYRPA